MQSHTTTSSCLVGENLYALPLEKKPWSHACSHPAAAANTGWPLDLREVEHGLSHVRDVHFLQVLEGLHGREGAVSWWVWEPSAQHPGQGFHHRVQLGSLCAGKERKKNENSGICALQVAVSCLQLAGGEHKTPQKWFNITTVLFFRLLPAPRWEMGNNEQSRNVGLFPNQLLTIHRALLQVVHFWLSSL